MVVEQRSYQQPTVSNLVKQLIGDINNLVQQHIDLFKAEIKADAEMAAKYTSVAVIGALVAYTSLIFFGFFLIFSLALILPLWASSLIVTILYTLIAVVAIILSRNHLKKLKTGVEGTVNETQKTGEEAKKWLQDLK